LYQHGFTKHVSMICNMQYTTGGERREKPLIVVAVVSLYTLRALSWNTS
jgi:beta-N-acetylhexosaminidase